MNIVVLSGSPRKGANTDTMVCLLYTSFGFKMGKTARRTGGHVGHGGTHEIAT